MGEVANFSCYFGVIIDSYLDKENAVAFFTTPTGLRWDGAVWNDAMREEDMSIDWNTFWEVAATYTDEGWFAEMRIPWSSLFFPEKRLFFQERASIFDFSFDGFNRLFYSRRIGITDDGDPVRIYGGPIQWLTLEKQ